MSTLNSKVYIFLFFSLFVLCPLVTFAQTSQMISVTPPLFQLSVAPGDIWQSSVKVVNGNSYPLTIYAEVVNFEAKGEDGRGTFIPIIAGDESKATLAEWIQISEGPHVIPEEQTADIPFFVEIPKDASPGGHFAAILIGTQPPPKNDESIAVATTQTVTSLFFVRIEGDVTELGNVREFSVLPRSVELPEAEFSLRFENKGNVLLQPRGDIIITNMWGKERGIVPINNQTHFGNVLPETIRDFKFSWKGEKSITDIGRYKAIATLAYGEDGIKSTTATTYFWIIPIRATLITVGVIVIFILLITWMIKRYVRKMLTLAGVDVDAEDYQRRGISVSYEREQTQKSYKHIAEPLKDGALDLRKRLHGVTEFFDVFRTIGGFVWNYKVFFGSLIILIVGFIVLALYIADVSQTSREYQVIINTGDASRVLNSDEIEQARTAE